MKPSKFLGYHGNQNSPCMFYNHHPTSLHSFTSLHHYPNELCWMVSLSSTLDFFDVLHYSTQRLWVPIFMGCLFSMGAYYPQCTISMFLHIHCTHMLAHIGMCVEYNKIYTSMCQQYKTASVELAFPRPML